MRSPLASRTRRSDVPKVSIGEPRMAAMRSESRASRCDGNSWYGLVGSLTSQAVSVAASQYS